MDTEESVNALRWYAIKTKFRDENRVDKNLAAWGVETFAPRIKKRRNDSYPGKPVFISQSLFPLYIFARFEAGRMLHKIYYTRGVRSVVSFNGRPLPVEDEVVGLIQSRVDDDGFVQLHEELKSGEEVVINDGPLKGISGVFNRAMKDACRVEILLNTITYQASIIVDKEMVQKAAPVIL